MVAQGSCTLAPRRRTYGRRNDRHATLVEGYRAQSPQRCRAILCPELEGAVSGETAWIPLVKAARVTTTDAVLTLAYSYAIPAHTIGDIEIVILGAQRHRGLDARQGNWRDRSVRRQRDLDGPNAEVQPFGATLTYTTAISGGGGELDVKVQGVNPETVKWLVVITVNQLTTVEV